MYREIGQKPKSQEMGRRVRSYNEQMFLLDWKWVAGNNAVLSSFDTPCFLPWPWEHLSCLWPWPARGCSRVRAWGLTPGPGHGRVEG